ncbi:MAG TPA: hypothetical protein VK116_09730, partial [Planctomycetota bacterium]|nr:hypothetical protein [Planctomycetota bacterium]
DRARSLLSAMAHGFEGRFASLDGFDGIGLHGSPEHLLPSELLYDEDEFLRRAIHGEQLQKLRQHATGERGALVVLLSVSPGSLGVPLRNAIGLALACRERWLEAGTSFLVVTDDEAGDLESLARIEALIDRPPTLEPRSRSATRRRLLSLPANARPSVIVETSFDERGIERWLHPEDVGVPPSAMIGFLVDRAEITAFTYAERRGEWVASRKASVPGDRDGRDEDGLDASPDERGSREHE